MLNGGARRQQITQHRLEPIFKLDERGTKMKSQSKYLTLAWSTVAVLFFVLGTQSAMAAPGTITGSPHDFSSGGTSAYKGSNEQTCIYCHTPHGAAGSAALWNRTMSSSTFTAYASGTLNAAGGGQPGNVSKLCLSCHDGTIAVDSYGLGAYAVAGTQKIIGRANIGADLSNDHPIGITYNAALLTADPGLKNPATTNVTIGASNTGTIAAKMLFGASNDTLECASCHDVHNSASGTAVTSKLLRVSNASSALCRVCHDK